MHKFQLSYVNADKSSHLCHLWSEHHIDLHHRYDDKPKLASRKFSRVS